MTQDFYNGSDVYPSTVGQNLFTSDPFERSTVDGIYFRYLNVSQLTTMTSSLDQETFRLRYGLLATVAITSVASILAVATSGGNVDSIYFRYSNDSQLTTMTSSLDTEPFRLRYGLLATVAITLLASILSLATSGGNLLVIAAFRVDSQLQRVNNYFLLSLAVADFAIGAVSMPLFTVYLLLGRWPIGKCRRILDIHSDVVFLLLNL